jgi:hypothetical protein
MRSIYTSLLLAASLYLSACATTGANHPVNIASVRAEINGTIRAHENDRAIHSMGHVDATKAVVYTTNKATGDKQEETWVKDGAGWKLESSTKVAATVQ